MSGPQVSNASNEQQVKRAGQRAKDLERQKKDDLATILTTPQGRRFVWDMLEFCGIYKDSFTGNSTTFYNEGRRSVGLWLLSEIAKAKPEALLEMMRANSTASTEPAQEKGDNDG